MSVYNRTGIYEKQFFLSLNKVKYWNYSMGKFIFDNPEGQWPMWATYLHTKAMFNSWHWQR